MAIEGRDAPDARALDHIAVLIAASAGGDRDALARLYDLLSPRVLGVIVRVLGDPAQSEEVLQETFLEVARRGSEFDANRTRGRSWVLAIAHRRAVERRRQAGAAPGADAADVRVEGRRMARAVAALPDSQRRAVALAYFRGLSQSEIAALIDAPLADVKEWMRDGLSRLRTELRVTS